jgi:hypothetical protein
LENTKSYYYTLFIDKKGEGMGHGFFYNGNFNLNVSLQYTPQAKELDFLSVFFNKASEILYDLTDGKHRIGTVFISTNASGSDNADILIWPCFVYAPPDMPPHGVIHSTDARLWFRTQSMDYNQDSLMYPTAMAHEFGHYLYSIADELGCQNSVTSQACLMEYTAARLMTGSRWERMIRDPNSGLQYLRFDLFWPHYTNASATSLVAYRDGEPTEFCCSADHTLSSPSCWVCAANDGNHNNIPYGLTAPSSGYSPEPTLPSNMPLTIVREVIPETRYELVLDRSGSMAGSKISQLKVGANFWIDYVNSGENLGIVSYSTTANLDLQLSKVPDNLSQATTWRNNGHSIVDALQPDDRTAIGDALRIAYNNIIGQQLAATQVIILFTDGLQNEGVERAEDVLPDIISAGIRVYTIGVGNDQDSILLGNIAITTGGSYFKIANDTNPEEAAQAISEALIQVAGESRVNSAVIYFREIMLDNKASFDEEDSPFHWSLPSYKIETFEDIKSFKFPVRISEGSSQCTLGVLSKNLKLHFNITVTDPSGSVVSEGPKVRHIRGKYPYNFYEIDNPMTGKWMVEVTGKNLFSTHFRTIGFEVNKNIRFEVAAKRPHIKIGEKIQLLARVMFQQLPISAHFFADIYSPSGKWSKVHFVPGDAKKGQSKRMYYAEIQTEEYPGEYLIWVKASFADRLLFFKSMSLQAKTKLERTRDFVKFEIPKLERTEFLSVRADSAGLIEDELIVGYNTKGPLLLEK